MNKATRAQRYLGAALVTSFAATLLSVGTVAAAEDVVVTGSSETTITLTLGSQAASFGSDLTPSGTDSDGDVNVSSNVDPASGACYQWDSTVTVSSNTTYEVGVAPVAANTKLVFMTTDPATYADCTTGTGITTTPFVAFDAQEPAAGAVHAYWLGLDVAWVDPVSSTLGDATLTFAAVANVV